MAGAILRVDVIEFYMRIILWVLIIGVPTWDPCLSGLPKNVERSSCRGSKYD